MDFVKELIKEMMGKAFYHALLAMVAAGFLFVVTPKDSEFIIKLTGLGYYCLSTITLFLAFNLITFIYSYVTKSINNKIKEDENFELNRKRAYEKVSEFYDSLTPNDRKILDWMVGHNNEPYIEEGEVYHHGTCLFNSNWVISQVDYKENSSSENSKNPVFLRVSTNKITKYKLKDDVYELLKYLKETYGKLSKF